MRTWFPRLLARDRPRAERARLDTLLEFAPAEGSHAERVLWLVDLVGWLRADEGEDGARKLRYLEQVLTREPRFYANVSQALTRLVAACDIRLFLAYGGIPHAFHFLGALGRWVSARLLPRACDTREFDEVLALAFRAGDSQLVARLCGSPFVRGLIDASLVPTLRRALSDALADLAHQALSLAHAPAIRGLAGVERSPFQGLYEAVHALDAAPGDGTRAKAVLGRIAQCQGLVESQRQALVQRGADLNTTFLLTRLRRQLGRLAALCALAHRPDEELMPVLGELCAQSLREQLGARLLWSSADLVVQNLVDTTAAVGRDYIALVETSTFSAFRAGVLGGLLMALATLVKLLLHGLELPTLYEGLSFALNYASVFVVAYLLHGTIATKLPAHTAAALARVLQRGPSLRARLAGFTVAFRATVRLQLAGLLGNVLAVAPAALLLAWAVRALTGRPLIDSDVAGEVLEAQSLLGPSLLYAALTGVLLWWSSLFGAFVDNWVRVSRLADRWATRVASLRTHPARARARADAVCAKLGGLAANAALGALLAGIPTLGALAALPVEIRHVTVSAGSVAIALGVGDHAPHAIALALSGVLAIGVVNVLVAFSLALWLALRATQGLEGDRASRALLQLGLRRFWGAPTRRAAAQRLRA